MRLVTGVFRDLWSLISVFCFLCRYKVNLTSAKSQETATKVKPPVQSRFYWKYGETPLNAVGPTVCSDRFYNKKLNPTEVYNVNTLDSPPIRYFNKSSALQEIPNTHMQLITFIKPLAPLLKVDILTNPPVQDGILILFNYISGCRYSAPVNVSGTSNEEEQTW